MREELSSGGAVIFGNSILLLKKFNGDWVLPKGRIEPGEDKESTALREVFEESGIRGNVIKYLGEIHYTFNEGWNDVKMVHKTVYWYLMNCSKTDIQPQRDEGFIDGKFMHMKRAIDLAKYDDEREIIKKVLKEYEKGVK
ncbi:MAG: NUDIX hydrolase [Filifactoraceae bacterium]